ncbi:SusC/RagA family TonB-linked outer membrane protein [Mucilaginibacter sp. SP1R1]|uniref:SusC/RagA family TonB-linked outer membrane protein n=1 Tax=Mucilaginibacter sp. SP1R1 TaxID=2723091 RepID=UPI0016084149|nr:SusC/RagA family TonB-linked outer membrane protein [Mucilaginibacter sp. SP1R1]MBB6149837.1 iron complex outermembrane receptor protein [Mucilaginibacter sp. SP1R1]
MKKIYQSFSKKTHCIYRHSLLLVCAVLFITLPALSQTSRIVKGTVTDETNSPLPGVVVTVKSSGKATTTNNNGGYSVTVNGPTDVLKFTFLGSVPKEVTIGDKASINISLVTDTKQLKDVVVIGYGTSSRKDVTGAITSVKAEDFNAGVLTTPAELLQGKVAGLNITKSGDPNKQPSTTLRGPSTLRDGATEPFYVIDGVPGASIDLLAPADIESIDVLKDASSTAIYGSRAANGVIIVTTRKAKTGQTRLNYSAYGAVENVSKNIDMLTGDELRKYLTDNGVPKLSTADDDGSNTNWQKLAERTGYSQNHNLSYGGAGTNSEYGASVNYMKNNGILKNTSLERTIYKGYINQRFFNDRLKLGITLTNSATKNNDIFQSQVLSGILFYLPTVSPFNPDGTYKENYTRTGSGPLNPLSLINNNFIKTENNKTLVNGFASLDILNGLKFTVSGSTQKEQNNVNTYSTSQSGIYVNAGGVAARSAYTNTSNVVEAYFNYDRIFGRHSLKLLGGYSYQQDRNGDGFGVQTQGFSNDALTYNYLAFSNPTQLSQIIFNPSYNINGTTPPTYISTLRLISFYARAQYQFADKYLLQASLREDGSSGFGLNVRHGYFPAASAGWKIISEDFMKSIPVISDLKLRAGYGVSGNSAGFDAFTAQLIYGVPPGGGKFLNNGNIVNPIGPVRNDNPNLKWESTATTNIGLDFGILNNRITGSVDYYIKKTSDLITTLQVSTTQYFYPLLTANVGKMKNSGVEVVLNAIPVKSGAFTWRTSLNFSHNKNVVQSLSQGGLALPYIQTAQLGGKGQSGNYSQIIQPGYAVGTFDLWHYLGKNSNGVSTYEKADGSTTAAQPLTTDQFIKYDAQPKLVYGWSNSFFYKNFDFNFLVRGVYGNKILNATLAGLNNPADSKLQNIPRFTLGESFKDINAYLISDRFLESGSYLRLDNATVGYTIKPHIQAFKSLRFYASGNNIFIITKYRGVDPEIDMGGLTPGIDNKNFYPKTRTFSLGINASF